MAKEDIALRLKDKLDTLVSLASNVQTDINRTKNALLHLPTVYHTEHERHLILQNHIKDYLEDILKLDRIVPDLNLCRLVLEQKKKYSTTSIFEWYILLPITVSKISYYSKIMLTETHPYLSAIDVDWEFVSFLERNSFLEVIRPL